MPNKDMTYFFDVDENVNGHMIHHKGRLYNVVDKSGNHQWYSFDQTTTADNGVKIAHSTFTDFDGGKFMGLTQEEINRAITRKSKQ